MSKIKKGQIYKSKNSGSRIQIMNKATGNKHWNTKKLNGSPNSHKIHEGSLTKYYELEQL